MNEKLKKLVISFIALFCTWFVAGLGVATGVTLIFGLAAGAVGTFCEQEKKEE